ncbi:probable 2-oxoglutarate dehydrogenase E1 component DHKTD1 homolog, mitochondrial [Phymastichus coffea]|uniref:probable 2-oxoglutarate dehydrogenase E1 component DHKTD1 homolog, mitochondrial n=1 Tax=Phymastichus coffea TaxID=108790 RepID=UPI00273A9595|nr:probable 2-oxoglutarate dehydrogenase E1 component DHKTD1 homolog, mitochondrial [Phymastichus coffea]
MYRTARLASRGGRETGDRWRAVLEPRGRRPYHSGSGVYGHRDGAPRRYEVPPEELRARAENSNFYRLLAAYREHGHKQADVNPIALRRPRALAELRPERFGLRLSDGVRLRGLLHCRERDATVAEALDLLDRMYSGAMSAEFAYLESEEEREWFARNFEQCHNEALCDETRRAIAKEMLKSQAFDKFLGVKFVSVKRYGAEGAESMMAFFHELFRLSAHDALDELVLCMPHRGRLNFLTGMLKFPSEKLFRKLRGLPEFPADAKATGDVISHFVSSTGLTIGARQIQVSMPHNPSHLEAVNPVAMGRTRALMQLRKEGAYSEDRGSQWSDRTVNVQVHGDAACVAQGVNQECLALSAAPNFEIGGSIHLVVNNQIGFTTPAARGRSSRYCTDIAKFVSAPQIHVNGDDPEMVVKATRLAFNYQRNFRKDVFVDLNCFRRWGHNELDDPTFTSPLTYKIIRNRPSIPDRYLDKLIESNVMTEEQGAAISERHTAKLNESLRKADSYEPERTYFKGRWSQLQQAAHSLTIWDTGVDANLLRFVAEKSVRYPAALDVHPTILKSHVQARLQKLERGGKTIDWSTAEAMAFGSLMYQGYDVRISGQDVGRATFSHRHAMLVDQTTGEMYIPLNSMVEGQTGKLEIANSILSEEAVLGFEYGMSITLPNMLPIWEAQFGDFFNGAQIIIDTFVSSGEAKWMTASGLVMILPHGYDGAGPEHSSSKFERFLQLTDSKEDKPDGDDINMQVVNPTTPAQYFHLLRRQMVRNFRKPLIIVSPKTLLRHPSALSSLEELAPNTSFKPVIGDDKINGNSVRRVILVSGKHYYALEKHRATLGLQHTAIVRVESLCPFPVLEINEELQKYSNAETFIWSQEEPQNMGAWTFIKPRFENLCGRKIRYCGREVLPTSAVGIGQVHQRQSEEVIVKPFTMK